MVVYYIDLWFPKLYWFSIILLNFLIFDNYLMKDLFALLIVILPRLGEHQW